MNAFLRGPGFTALFIIRMPMLLVHRILHKRHRYSIVVNPECKSANGGKEGKRSNLPPGRSALWFTGYRVAAWQTRRRRRRRRRRRVRVSQTSDWKECVVVTQPYEPKTRCYSPRPRACVPPSFTLNLSDDEQSRDMRNVLPGKWIPFGSFATALAISTQLSEKISSSFHALLRSEISHVFLFFFFFRENYSY